MRLVWRETLAAHQPYGLVWELVDGELNFHIVESVTPGGSVQAWLSPVYAYIHRTGKRRYAASVTTSMTFTGRTFQSLTKAKAWAQALVALNPPT